MIKIEVLKVIGKLEYPRFASVVDKWLIDAFNKGELGDLFLDVFTEYQEESLDSIMEEGMYLYRTPQCSELAERLQELSDYASPADISVRDIVIVPSKDIYRVTNSHKATELSKYQPSTVVKDGIAYQTFEATINFIEDRGEYWYVGYTPLSFAFGRFGCTRVYKDGRKYSSVFERVAR